jgi:squalene-hopene/tetraprenyl-beta-curcumene cyclase
VQRACRLLLASQHAEGWWPDPAIAEVTVAAEGLLALEMLAVRTPAATTVAARQIRSVQRADGSWAGGEPGAAADLSASVLAYLALRLAGDSPDAYHMAAAAGWIRDAGGIDAVGATARAWLAMFGLTAWARVPVPAPEASSLLERATAAGTVRSVTAIALAVLGALRPASPPPATLTELQAIGRQTGPSAVVVTAPHPTRGAARPAVLRRYGWWLADWHLQAGRPDSGRPLSLAALHALGYPPSHPALAAGLARLAGVDGPPGGCGGGLPPVAQTALATEALSAAGVDGNRAALLAAGRWLRQQVAMAASGPGAHDGWRPRGWSFCPDGCARPADTACVLIALSALDLRGLTGVAAPADAARWLAETQRQDGSWGGSATVTGYCVRALTSQPVREPTAARAIRRGVIWLLRAQLPVGGWPGGHGDCDLLATTVALAGLRSAGVLPGKPSVTGAVGWLLAERNADGGWPVGGIAGPSRRPGRSDAVGTAQALSALLAVGGAGRPDADAAAGWLIRAQLPDGSWACPARAADSPLPGQPARPADVGHSAAGVLLPLRALGSYTATLAQRHDAG